MCPDVVLRYLVDWHMHYSAPRYAADGWHAACKVTLSNRTSTRGDARHLTVAATPSLQLKQALAQWLSLRNPHISLHTRELIIALAGAAKQSPCACLVHNVLALRHHLPAC